MVRVIRALLFAPFFAPWSHAAEPKKGDPGTTEYRQAAELVKELGNARYAKREQASAKLLAMGFSALPAIKEGFLSQDEEIGTRCRKLLPLVRKSAWGQLAKMYADDVAGKHTHDLPFLTDYEQLMGRVPLAVTERELFAELIRTNGEWLGQVHEAISRRSTLIADRTRQLLEWDRKGNDSNTLEIGDLAAVLLVSAVLPEGKTTRLSASLLDTASTSPAIRSKQYGSAFRKLMIQWLGVRSMTDSRALHLFLNKVREIPFPEAVPILVKLAREEEACALTIRVPALNALGQVGGAEAEAVLASLIDDATPVHNINPLREGPSQLLGDSALANWLILQQVNPEKYGLQANNVTLLLGTDNPESTVTVYGFESQTAREQAKKPGRKEAKKK